MPASAAVELGLAQLAVIAAAVLLRRYCPDQLFEPDGGPRDMCPEFPIPLWAVLTLAGLLTLWLIKKLKSS
jgi:hypothetical protein